MDAFEDSALPHIDSVARFALSLTHNEGDANDLVQETFLRAFRSWHTFAPVADCQQWLLTICHNAFIRLNSRTLVHAHPDEVDMDAMPAAIAHMQAVKENVADAHDRIDVRPAVEAAVRALPEPHHSILVLVDLVGLSYEQAAAVLESRVALIRPKLYRARRHVQEAVLAHAREAGLEAGSARIRTTPADTEAQWNR